MIFSMTPSRRVWIVPVLASALLLSSQSIGMAQGGITPNSRGTVQNGATASGTTSPEATASNNSSPPNARIPSSGVPSQGGTNPQREVTPQSTATPSETGSSITGIGNTSSSSESAPSRARSNAATDETQNAARSVVPTAIFPLIALAVVICGLVFFMRKARRQPQ